MDEFIHKNKMIPVLYSTAFVMIILCLCVTIWAVEANDYAQGIVTLILGRQLGYTDQVYAYFLSTTKSSTTKDATIATLTAADSNSPKEPK